MSPRLLFFPHRPWPCDHVVLEEVFAKRLPALGREVDFVMQPARREDVPAAAATAAPDHRWHGADVWLTRRRHWRGPRRHVELWRQSLALGRARLAGVSIVQARTGLPEAWAARTLAREAGVPFVYQCSFPTALGRRAALASGPLAPLAPAWHAAESALLDRVVRDADLVLAISDEMARELRARGARRVEAFPLCAEVAAAGPAQPLPPETVLYFGSMDRKRRLGFLLEAFARVRAKSPAASLVMLGEPGPELPAQVRQMGLGDAVRFPGRVPREAVPAWVRGAALTVAPVPPEPLYVVASTTKVVESLACGVPVVANREIPDHREVLDESGGGLAPEYAPEAFAAAILELLADPAAARARGAAGRDWIARHRSADALARRAVALYDELRAGARR